MQIMDMVNGVPRASSLVGATVRVYVTGITLPYMGSALAAVENPLIGSIRYEWGNEVQAAGTYQIEVGVTKGLQTRRYPTRGYIELRVGNNLS